MGIKSKKEVELTVDGIDVEILSDLLEFARRYIEKTRYQPADYPLELDEFNKNEMDLFRVKLNEFFEALR